MTLEQAEEESKEQKVRQTVSINPERKTIFVLIIHFGKKLIQCLVLIPVHSSSAERQGGFSK